MATATENGGDPTWMSPSSLTFAGGLTATESVSSGTLQSQHEFTLVPRNNAVLGYPVPVFRPSTANVPLALDIQPNGTGLNSNNGYCWLDACDGDTTGNPTVADASHAVNTARLAAQSDHTSVGGASVGGAHPKPFWIRVPTNGNGGHPADEARGRDRRGGLGQRLHARLRPVRHLERRRRQRCGDLRVSGRAASTPYGFIYVPQIATAPTGTPHSYGASNALCYVKGQRLLKAYDASLSEWVTFTGT